MATIHVKPHSIHVPASALPAVPAPESSGQSASAAAAAYGQQTIASIAAVVPQPPTSPAAAAANGNGSPPPGTPLQHPRVAQMNRDLALTRSQPERMARDAAAKAPPLLLDAAPFATGTSKFQAAFAAATPEAVVDAAAARETAKNAGCCNGCSV